MGRTLAPANFLDDGDVEVSDEVASGNKKWSMDLHVGLN